MKHNTLYVTDLDGTLLNENAVISQKTSSILRPLLAQGLRLTVATARSPATVVELMRPLGLTLPAVLMTGAMLYDLQHTCPLGTHGVAPLAVHAVCDVLEQSGQEALAYAVRDSHIYVYYKEFRTKLEQHFVSSRLHSPYKTFSQCTNYHTALAGAESLMFLLCVEELHEAHAFYLLLSKIQGVVCHFYPYEYETSGYLLEVYAEGCSKASGLGRVRQTVCADRVVGFGDNINDLPLFAACDESCAVENACEDAKNAATHIIGANTRSGVAQWIAKDFLEQC